MDELSAEDLVELVRAGDNSAARELFNKFAQPLSSHVWRKTQYYGLDPDVIGGICQESWERAFREIDKLREPGKFYPWVKRISSRKVSEVSEKEKERRLIELFDTEGEYHKALSNGVVPTELRQKFENKGFPLSGNVTVLTRRKDQKWLLVDRDNHRTYTTRKRRSKLTVYLPGKPGSGYMEIRNVETHTPDVEQIATARESAEIVADTMTSSLTSQQYEVYSLKLKGWGNGEIAEELGMTSNNVRVLSHKAKERVIGEIGQKYGYSPEEVRSEIARTASLCPEYLAELLNTGQEH